MRLAKVSSEFERLKHKAVEFNALIDEAIARFDEMREIGREISSREHTFLVVSAETKEMAYASIHDSIIRIRRRGDVMLTS